MSWGGGSDYGDTDMDDSDYDPYLFDDEDFEYDYADYEFDRYMNGYDGADWSEYDSNHEPPSSEYDDEESIDSCAPDSGNDTLKFCEKLNTLRNCEKYCDLVIQVEDKTFYCHKIILAASSEYFDGMIGGNFQESKQDRISLNMMSAKTFETILSFMYTRNIQVDDENATDLLMASDFLGIHHLKESCFKYIRDNYETLPIENVLEVYQFTLNTSEHKPGLIRKLFKYLADHFSVFCQSSLFPEISYVVLNSMLQTVDYELNGDGIVEAIIQWVNYKLDDRKVHLAEIIEMIKFGTTDAPYLKVLEKFSADCNQPEVISNSQLIPSTSNAVPKGLSTLHLYFRYRTVSPRSTYLGILALDRKLEWKCYSRRNTVSYIDGNETKQASPDLVVAESRRTVSGENLYHILQDAGNEYRFFRSHLTNMNKQTRLKNPPLKTKTARLCSIQDKVYLHYRGPDRFSLVGSNSYNQDYSPDELRRNIFVYHSEPDKWFSVPLPPVTAENSFVVSCDNSLYLLGASVDNGLVSKVCRYDSRTPKWDMMPSMWYKNRSPAACECNGKIYVCSGNSYKVEFFDPVANKWDRISRRKKMSHQNYKDIFANSGQRYLELASHNDLIWALEDNTRARPIKTADSDGEAYERIGVDIYDPKTNKWSTFESPDVAMKGLGDDSKSGPYKLMDFINIPSS